MKQEYLKNAIEYWEGVHKPIDREAIPVDDWLDIFEDLMKEENKEGEQEDN